MENYEIRQELITILKEMENDLWFLNEKLESAEIGNSIAAEVTMHAIKLNSYHDKLQKKANEFSQAYNTH